MQAETLVRVTEQSLQALMPQQLQHDRGTQTEVRDQLEHAMSKISLVFNASASETISGSTTSRQPGDTQIKKWENSSEDTATWLHRLVFQDEQVATSNRQNSVGNLSDPVPDLLLPINRAAKAPVVDRLLLRWTNLSADEIKDTSKILGRDEYAAELAERVRLLSVHHSAPELAPSAFNVDTASDQTDGEAVGITSNTQQRERIRMRDFHSTVEVDNGDDSSLWDTGSEADWEASPYGLHQMCDTAVREAKTMMHVLRTFFPDGGHQPTVHSQVKAVFNEIRSSVKLITDLADVYFQAYHPSWLFKRCLAILLSSLRRTIADMETFCWSLTSTPEIRWEKMCHDMATEAGYSPAERFALYNQSLSLLYRLFTGNPGVDTAALKSTIQEPLLQLCEKQGIKIPLELRPITVRQTENPGTSSDSNQARDTDETSGH